MKKYITILAVSLVCHAQAAEDTRENFQSVDGLIAHIKQADPEHVLYDTNGFVVGVELVSVRSTDHNLQLLSQIKSLRYLSSGFSSTNKILALAKFPNLSGLRLMCSGGNHLLSALPCLTNLQSLELVQNAYETNDTIYLARMTNLVALEICGAIAQTQAELLPITNLVNLRTLVIWGSDEYINKMDTNILSRLNKLNHFVITPNLDLIENEEVWKKPYVK
jgi:hypothetical protein